MNFTWWVYWVAIRRARRSEQRALEDYYLTLAGPEGYLRTMALKEALLTRRWMKVYRRVFGRDYEV